MKTVAPMVGPAINSFFGAKTTEKWKIADHLSLANAIISKLPTEGRGGGVAPSHPTQSP